MTCFITRSEMRQSPRMAICIHRTRNYGRYSQTMKICSLKSPVTSITTELCLATGGQPFNNRNDRVAVPVDQTANARY